MMILDRGLLFWATLIIYHYIMICCCIVPLLLFMWYTSFPLRPTSTC